MRTSLILLLLWPAAPLFAEVKPITGRITSVQLFKNGLGIVAYEVAVPGPGTYVLDRVPSFVHGSYSVEAAVPVETSVRTREVEVPLASLTGGSLQEELAGQLVTIYLKSRPGQTIQGTVLSPPPIEAPDPESAELNRRFGNQFGLGAWDPSSRFLVLRNDKGQILLDQSEVAYVESSTKERTKKTRKPVLALTVGDTGNKPVVLKLRYMARGLAWAPNYRIDIADPKNLRIEQTAAIKNTYTDLQDVDVSLATGFPNVPFSHVTSPLTVGNTWTRFFDELRQKGEPDAPVMSQMGMQHAPGYQSALGSDKVAVVGGDRMDVHYHAIGKRSLAVGDSLALTVARQQTPYERIVEWIVLDRRDRYGQLERRDDEIHHTAAQPWDALRFKNPFPFPMTTAPAWVEAGNQFQGQCTSPWVQTGDDAFLRINLALSIRAIAGEEENSEKTRKDSVMYDGRSFHRRVVDGSLTIRNLRAEPVPLVIRRRFSGDLVNADNSPKKILLEEGIYSVNRRNELLWQLTLPAGEEKKITYQYTVLALH